MITSLIAVAAVAVAAAGITAVQLVQRRRARRRAENERIKAYPRDFLHERGARLTAELVRYVHAVNAWMGRAEKARRELDELPPPPWTGVRRVLRVVCLVLLPALAVASAILNIEVFVALNGGVISPAAVLKGVGASVVELGLTLYLAEQIERRRPRDLDWQIRIAACLVLLTIVIGYVAAYAPARSQHALQHTISLDERKLTAAESADASSPSSGTKLTITAAKNDLTNDVARLQRAERSDAGQSIAFPVAEVLIGELALGGWIAAVDLLRRRRRRRTVDRAVRRRQAFDRRADQITAKRRAQAEARLIEADVADVLELMQHGYVHEDRWPDLSASRSPRPAIDVTPVGRRDPESTVGPLGIVRPVDADEMPAASPAAGESGPQQSLSPVTPDPGPGHSRPSTSLDPGPHDAAIEPPSPTPPSAEPTNDDQRWDLGA